MNYQLEENLVVQMIISTHISDFWIWYSTTFEEANAIQKVQGNLKASDLGNAESTYILTKLYLSKRTKTSIQPREFHYQMTFWFIFKRWSNKQ